jgi:hypothetical protein
LHELLEAHYTGYGWEKKQKELTKEFNKLFEEEREYYGNLPEICRRIMRGYVYHWREQDSGLTVVEVEKEYEIELPHGHTYAFKIDALVEDEYGLWLMENKSHKTIPGDDYRFLDIQTTKYVYGLIQLGYPIIGVLWNYLCTIEPKKPKLVGHREKDGPRLSKARIRTDVLTFVEALHEYGLDPQQYRDDIVRLKRHNTFFRRERVPRPAGVMKRLMQETIVVADEIERGYKPIRTIERGCENFCPYLNLCMTSLYGGDTKPFEKNFQKAKVSDYYGYAEESAKN